MKKIMILVLVALLLAGCGDTMVYIPEEASRLEGGQVVYIPMDPDKTEETVPALPEPTQPEETEPEQKNTATVSKKPAASSNKGTTSNKTTTTNKETVTGSAKPAETEPVPPENAGSGQITVTEPVNPEPTATEPTATEPPETEPPLYDISDYTVSDLEYAMLDRINEYRLEEGLEEMWLDEYLCAIASYRGYEASLVWSHTRPDGRGYWTVLDDYGYGGGASGELLGYATGDGAAVVDKWMNSESHRTLLMGTSSTLGIGIYYAGGVIYVACLMVG